MWVKYEWCYRVGLTPGQETANNAWPLISQEAFVFVNCGQTATVCEKLRAVSSKISVSTDLVQIQRSVVVQNHMFLKVCQPQN